MKKEKKIVFVKDEIIYFGKIDTSNEIEIINNLNKGIIPKKLFSLPFSYIKSVELASNSNKILFKFNESSEEEIIVLEEKIRDEIFEYLKNEMTDFEYELKIPSLISYTKAQLFAILFSIGFFFLSYTAAIKLESGEVLHSKRKITSLIYTIASIGSENVIKLFSVLILIAILSFILKFRKRTETAFLLRMKYNIS
ncbi:hypothetical protein [Aureivirga marina]|uniref:hypothetical protein n=1 Tax=Aureivirga marina TaxID=1182451 RepID=UPI0018CA15B8|nr:hypothetical protein [Aureivirga marina]